MVVALPALKIAYMPVPKAACTSVKGALALIDPDTDITLDELAQRHEAAHALYPTMRFRLHRWQNYEGWWRFTVLRDPLSRLLSVYTDRVVGRDELRNSPKLRRQTELTLEPDPDFFFQNIRAYMPLSSVIKHHALPTKLFVGDDLHVYDEVYTLDRLTDLQRDLSERSGQTVVLPRHNKSKMRLSYDDLQPKTQAVIRDFLAPEYDHLSDYFTAPYGSPQKSGATVRIA